MRSGDEDLDLVQKIRENCRYGSTVRVTHCYRTYFPDPPGGLQEAIRQICLATAPLGVENRVFCLSPTPKPRSVCFPEGEVLRCRSWWAPASCDIGGISAFRQFITLSENSDVLHFHFPWPFADLLRLAARKEVPAVITYHSDIVRQKWLDAVYRPLMWSTFSRADAIVATSPDYMRTSTVLSDPRIRERVSVIPLGINETAYQFAEDALVLEKFGLKADSYFLFIGVLRYYKGLDTLIEAAKKVHAPVVIAGSGPEDRVLRRMVAEQGISRVIFTGQVSEAEKIALLRGCRAFVLPSHLRSEAFGMVLVEASMFGRPLISCAIGSGTSFVNLHEETGLVVSPADPAALAEAMNRLHANPTLAQVFGDAARKRYEHLFSGEALGRAYAQLYAAVCK